MERSRGTFLVKFSSPRPIPIRIDRPLTRSNSGGPRVGSGRGSSRKKRGWVWLAPTLGVLRQWQRGGRGEDRFSLRSYEVPSTSLDPREVSLLSPSRRPYLSSSRSTTYTTTTLPSRTVSLRITDAVRSLPRTSSTRGSAQFRSWNRRALVSPEISTPDQTIVYYFFLSNFSAFLTLL